MTKDLEPRLMSGNQAVALAALHLGVSLGVGYPGTPSTEILENFSLFGGLAQWSPNEKVALEVGIGVAYSGARALVTMKHVGVNVAADPLFTVAYTGVPGGLVLISADDPGMGSSQNEQDNRRYAVAAGVMMLEPADAQESYDFLFEAFRLSEEWKLPVLFRMTTRVCHSRGIVRPRTASPQEEAPAFVRDPRTYVMIPGYARPAHKRLRQKLNDIQQWNESSALNEIHEGDSSLGIITAGVTYLHTREAAPEASVLKLGMTYPLPLETIRKFAASVDRCLVIEENDPYMVDAILAAGIPCEGKEEMYRFGELNIARVKHIIDGDHGDEAPPPPGKPPELCKGCPHRMAFAVMNKFNCIIAGDIGCYTLSVLPPFESLDTCVCMGASVGVGLGLRHALPDEEARRVISVIGDSTFVHSGLTGIVEMVYNPPKTGHVLVILDNGTTAMTGMQEHPGTGRALDHEQTGKLVFENVIRAMGVPNVHVVSRPQDFEALLRESLEKDELSVIILRKVCILAEPKLARYEAANKTTKD
ncbi:MAG: thiamine pyrophosphate-binding protein [Candidatus Hydrogenedens sp.]|nr:thiamine pyrophosphate-binding protein [Candidatus Hydrogenedens sp.]